MLEYIAVLLIGFWLGVAIFLYASCYWLEEIFDLPPARNETASSTTQHTTSSSGGGGASGAHARLKRLVARVVEEAAALPALARYAAEPVSPPGVESSTYEDLLATAILNKVIERYQTENGSGGRSSGIHSASASPTPSERSSPRSLNSRTRTRDISPPLPEEDDISDWEEGETTDDTLELPKRVPFPEFGRDIVHQDNTDRDFDEVSGSDIQAVDGTWEENWLFQKKKIKTIQSVPVPMLVPNSNAEYRALIGDRDADDTTDLSDNASDQEDQDHDYKSNIKNVLDSKHVIGGKSKIEEILDFEPDSLTIIDDEKDFDLMTNQNEEKIVDAINDEISDANYDNEKSQCDQNILSENEQNSILILGIDSGPMTKTEFFLKEEIHRTMLNNNAENISFQDLDKKINGNVSEDVVDSMPNFKESINTLSRHEREGEYEETVTIPVQRHADSLRRKHFDDEPQQIPTRDTDKDVADLIPGSIAYRERRKWLNYVDMPNNPYSPEAIKKRLSAKSTSSLFDSITSKSKDLANYNTDSSADIDNKLLKDEDIPVRDEDAPTKSSLMIHCNNNFTSEDKRSLSPAPKILKDVLAEEVPQYKRYGRDYYIKEAKMSAGGRKKCSYSDTSSLSSLNKSTSLDNFDTEFAAPVSASSSLSDLEACALHQNIVRAVLSPRNASPNFAINPIFEHPDKQNDSADEIRPTDKHNVGKNNNVRKSNVSDEGDGFVENEDIIRLCIPKKPEITEELFESYSNVRRNNTLRSEDISVRSKRRPALNYTFGGSLRLSKGFCTDLW
ncbi:hypothetical protein ACJJTC_015537 [Scirpophaga incertulas]